ncbi:MAG: hypothetical protein HKP14_07585, partial [Bacteroidia bacterium]|nr:hypothetical protein [Bacteroidia bacterium]
KKAVCLTLGSGSTARSHQLHEYAILKAPMNIVQSNQTWLLRPNYEDRQDEDNVLVAVNEATSLAQVIGKEWNKLF